jgi:hypothetical protein
LTSHRQIKSNRANARASTGPKTTHGKARSARNAHRHGLSLPVLSVPGLSEEVEGLAREIAGAEASWEIQQLARRMAEAQIELKRVRYARHRLLSGAIGDPDYESPGDARNRSKAWAYVAKHISRLTSQSAQTFMLLAARTLERAKSRREGAQKFADIISDMTKQLAAMDRYERGALARRKFAIRAFDTARASARDRPR